MKGNPGLLGRRLYSIGLITACIATGAFLWLLSVVLQWRSSAGNRATPGDGVEKFVRWLGTAGYPNVLALLGNVGVGLVTAAIFLLMVDRVLESRQVRDEQRREESRETLRLIERLKVGGEVGDVALVDLRTSGALYNGALTDSNLSGLDLSGRDLNGIRCSRSDLSSSSLSGSSLVGAILVGVKLDGSQLTGADLSWSDLRGAIVEPDSLKRAGSLWRCTLPDGSRYDGGWNLPGDVAAASKYGVDLNSPAERIQFYLG